MEYREVWSIPLDRISDFFARNSRREENGFFWDGCRITLTQLPPRPMGPWPIPQTQVCIRGPKEQAQKIYRRFFLTFVSAGG